MSTKNLIQHGSGLSTADIMKPTPDNFQDYITIIKSHLKVLGVLQYAQGEDLPDEPVWADYPDDISFSEDHRDWRSNIDRIDTNQRIGIGIISNTLLLSDHYKSQARRIINSDPEMTLRQVWRYTQTGFVEPTAQQINKAQSKYKLRKQRLSEKVETFFNKLLTAKDKYVQISGAEISEDELVVQFLSNVVPSLQTIAYPLKTNIEHLIEEQEQIPEISTIVQTLKEFEQEYSATIKDDASSIASSSSSSSSSSSKKKNKNKKHNNK